LSPFLVIRHLASGNVAFFLAKIVSAMEIETAVRSRLPLLVFVINNNGIYFGLDSAAYNKTNPLPSTALSPDTRYDMIAEVQPFLELVNVRRVVAGGSL
jgi:hypothetical protein